MIPKKIKKLFHQYDGEKGQVLAMAALTILSIVMFWTVMVNMGRLVKSRVIATNAADNAAQSATTIKARGKNMLGGANSVVAGLLSVPAASPAFVWYPEPSYGSMWPGGYRVRCNIAKNVKNAVEVFTKAGDSKNDLMEITRLAFETGSIAAAVKAARGSGAKAAAPIEGSMNPTPDPDVRDMHLEKKTGKINYYCTLSIWFWTCSCCTPPECHINYIPPIPWGESLFDVTPIRGEGYPDCESWYYMEDENEDQFADTRQTWVSYVESKPAILGKLIDLDEIPSTSAMAASREYNTGGRMYPIEERGDWGTTVVPIADYVRAVDDGWKAQLIPLEGGFFKH